jgi:hypothetical protein
MTLATDRYTRALINSNQVEGTAVFNVGGERLGSIDCMMIDKQNGHVAYAVMAFGGFLGLGEKRHPVPWASMTYDTSKDGYVIPLSKEELKTAPTLDPDQYKQLGDPDYDAAVYTHYKAEPYWL